MFLLGIDTCGPSGSVAIGSVSASGSPETLALAELEGRTYSATLIPTLDRMLTGQGIRLTDVGCLVVVSGPGSFTGVRVGLSAAKGLAEGAGTPVVAVSRLQVLAWKAGVRSAALDAHRNEIYLRRADSGHNSPELLAGAVELADIAPPEEIAVCDDAAAGLLRLSWPAVEIIRVAAPTAADAFALAAPEIAAGHFADIARLDGHYLRRSDAEIFGNTVRKA